MKSRMKFIDFLMAFLVCTACITILEGVIGMFFFPEEKLGYYAFFSPPLFGFFSVLFGIVTYSKKELSIRQVLVRRGIHLLLIEGMVLGLNYASGSFYSSLVCVVVALSVALVFVLVYVVLWVDDLKSAALFNERLKVYQDSVKKGV